MDMLISISKRELDTLVYALRQPADIAVHKELKRVVAKVKDQAAQLELLMPKQKSLRTVGGSGVV